MTFTARLAVCAVAWVLMGYGASLAIAWVAHVVIGAITGA